MCFLTPILAIGCPALLSFLMGATQQPLSALDISTWPFPLFAQWSQLWAKQYSEQLSKDQICESDSFMGEKYTSTRAWRAFTLMTLILKMTDLQI